MIKNIVKKILFIILNIGILYCVCNFNSVFAANYQNYEYQINSDNSTVTITGYLGNDKEITIPSTITIGTKNYEVISIGENAFYGNTKLTKVIIPESIITIGNDAFKKCSSKLTLYAPYNSDAIDYAKSNNIQYLIKSEDYVYSANNSSSISIKEYLGTNSNITIPSELDGKKVIAIDENVFAGDKNIQNVTIAQSVTKIGKKAFSNCIKLKSVTIPDSVTDIDVQAFDGCSKLTDIVIPKKLKTIPQKMFYKCTALSTIEIPENITKIDNKAFAECTSLSSVTIPSNVIELGEGVFNKCNNLKIYCKSGSKASSYAKENNINYILQDAPRKLSIVQIPNKVVYKEGENFDKTGMILQVTYNDGTTKNIDNYEIIDGEGLTKDKNIITLSYTENDVTLKLRCALNVEDEEPKEEPKIVLNKENGTLDINGTLKFLATITPEDIASQKVIWKSEDENIVTVNENGVVKGVNIGSTNITATTEDGKCTTSCQVMVVSLSEDYYGPVITIEVLEDQDEFAKVRISVTDRENPIKSLVINDIDCTKNLNKYNEIETKIYKNVDYEIIAKDANGNISTFIYNYNNTNGEVVTCENGEILREVSNGEGIDEDVKIDPGKSEIVSTTPSIVSNTNNIIIIIVLIVVAFGVCVHIGVRIKNMRKI